MTHTINIQNLKCNGCATTIKTQLSKLDDVTNIIVDNTLNSVSFNALKDNTLMLVKQKLSALGYPSEDETNTIPKKAKSFVSCAIGRISK